MPALLICLLLMVCINISLSYSFSFNPTFKSPRFSKSLVVGDMLSRKRVLQLHMGFGDAIAAKMTGVLELIVGQSTITEANIEDTLKEVKTILLDADVNLQVTNLLISKVKDKALGMKLDASQKPGEQFISLLAAELVDTMGQGQAPLVKRGDGRPNVILLAGLQGAGKAVIYF